MSKWSIKDFFRYIIKALGWTVFFLLLTEAFLRIFVISPVSIQSMRRGNVLEIYGYEGYGIVYYHPNMEIASIHDDGQKSVIVLGDSFTQARHVPYWKNYVSVSEDKLYAVGNTDCNLRNFGYRRQNMAYYLGVGPSIIATYHPTAIVLQVNYTDFDSRSFEPSDTFFLQEQNGSAYIQNGSNYKKFLKDNIDSKPPFSLLTFLDLSHSSIQYAVEWQYSNFFPEATPKQEDSSSASQEGLANSNKDTLAKSEQTRQLEGIISLIDSVYGKTPIIFLFIPTPRDHTYFTSIPDKNSQVIDRLAKHPGWHVIYPVKEFQASLLDGNAPHGFGNTEPMYGHINVTGHQIIGEVVADELMNLGICGK